MIYRVEPTNQAFKKPQLPIGCQRKKQTLIRFMFELRSKLVHLPTVIKTYNGVLISQTDRTFKATIGGSGKCCIPCWTVVGHKNSKGIWDVSVENTELSFHNIQNTMVSKQVFASDLARDAVH